MKEHVAILVSLLLAVGLPPGVRSNRPHRELHGIKGEIANGRPAKPGQFPFMVVLFDSDSLTAFCGGSLLTPNMVLTAAHCVKGVKEDDVVTRPAFVRVGMINVNEPAVVQRNVARVFVHPGFDYSTAANDVALLKLQKPVQGVPVARLADPKLKVKIGQLLTVAGFGYTPNSFDVSDILLYTNLHFVSRSDCQSYYDTYDSGTVLPRSHMCAGSLTKSDSCAGDSGGPLLTQGPDRALVGIVSYGTLAGTCGNAGNIGAYTDVRVVRPWIDRILGLVAGGSQRPA